MSWLIDQPLWLLVAICVGALTLVAIGGWLAGRWWFGDSAADAAAIAAPLMPALGAAFAVLAAFAVAASAADLRDAEADVAREANAAARLAWATGNHGDEGTDAQGALGSYLRATAATEWSDIAGVSAGEGRAHDEIADLEGTVRSLAASTALTGAAQAELLTSLDELAGARRSRFAAAAPLSPGVLVLLVISATALVLNATVLAAGRDRRAAVVLASLVAVTGVSIASVLALSAPFSGAFAAIPTPIVDIAGDLDAGRFVIDP